MRTLIRSLLSFSLAMILVVLPQFGGGEGRLSSSWSLFTATGTAQAAPSDSAPVGVRLPWTFAPEQEGVESTLSHAAGLGFLDGAAFGVGFSTGVLGALPLDGMTVMGGARVGALGAGLAYSYVGEPGQFGDGTHRVDFSVALRALSSLSLGAHILTLSNELTSETDDTEPTSLIGTGLDGYTSLGLSSTWRPARALSVALGIERLNMPVLADESLSPVVTLGLALRPGTERVAFGVEGRVDASRDPAWAAGGTLRIMPAPGVTVAAYGRYGQTPGQVDMLEWGGYLALTQGALTGATTVDRHDPATAGAEPGMSVGGLVTLGTSQEPSIYTPSGKIVQVTIAGPIDERRPVELLAPKAMPFGYWLVLLDVIAQDADVDGVLLDLRRAPLWAQSWELRQAIARLKAAGKSVTARITWGDMRGMYLASAADRIYLHPAGGFMLHGLAITRTYLKGLLEKVGVNAQFVKWEAYKSAPEPLTRTGPSEPAQEQGRKMLEGFDRLWHEAVSLGRSLSHEELDAILASGPQTMKMAHEQRLVDRIVHDDALEEALSEDLGRQVTLVEGYRPPRRAWRRWRSPRRIAIVPVVGTIVDGRSGRFRTPWAGATTGEVDFISAMKRAAKDPQVVGIVVRVSSPGGSVVASERMHRAVVQAMEDKPVVVSFGDIAASGGYYLACAADRIVAAPLTITGSIGIFTGKVDLSGLYAKLGVTSHTQGTTPSADAAGMHRPWTPEELARAQERLETYYELFLGHVASGRHMDIDKARARAGGRVYLGERALALDLVDAEGSLWDAVQSVRERAGIDVDEPLDLGYGPERGLLDKLSVLLTGALGGTQDAPPLIPAALAPLARLFGTLVSLQHGGVQARLPYDIEVQ